MTAADLATGPEGGTLDAVLGRLNALDVLVHSGIRVTAGPDGAVVARVADPGPEHVEQGAAGAVINVVMIMGLADCALAVPAILAAGGARCATLESAIKLAEPLGPGPFEGRGRVVGRQGDLFTVEVTVVDDQGRIGATATGLVARI